MLAVAARCTLQEPCSHVDASCSCTTLAEFQMHHALFPPPPPPPSLLPLFSLPVFSSPLFFFSFPVCCCRLFFPFSLFLFFCFPFVAPLLLPFPPPPLRGRPLPFSFFFSSLLFFLSFSLFLPPPPRSWCIVLSLWDLAPLESLSWLQVLLGEAIN